MNQAHTTHHARRWLRRNPEYCAQRRTLVDFDVSNHPKIHFWGNLVYIKIEPNFKLFMKLSNFHVHGPDLEAA